MLPVIQSNPSHELTSPPLWKQIFRQNFRKWEELADFLTLSPEQRQFIHTYPHFPLNLPRRLAQKIEKGTLNDPILKQFLPTLEETYTNPNFVKDPVGDGCSRQSSKLLHKYEGRVLLVCSSACAMHCRYCFRQNFDYDVSTKGFDEELQLIAEDNSIHEVILSGGDPLSLSNRNLQDLVNNLSMIPQIKRLRFHTRFPIGIPERIDQEFLEIIENSRFQIWFVIHVNHPNELDEEILAKLKNLQRLRVLVLNQAVLLNGINNDANILKDLCERLVDNGIIPYYLHQLDRVQGAAHFEVDPNEGIALIQKITAQLPGYAIPKYVQEIAGEPSKTPISPLKIQ